MQAKHTNGSAGRQAAERWAAARVSAIELLRGWMSVEALMVEAFEAGRASVLGDTSEPVADHGLCSCGALDPCEGGHP